MSLINDALKRAHEAQQKTEQAPAPELKFRGIDPRANGRKGFGWVLPGVITACVVIGIFAIWQMKSGHAGGSDKNAAQSEARDGKSADAGSMKIHAREQDALPGGPLASMKIPDAPQSEKVAVVAVSGTTIQETTKGQGTNAAGLVEMATAKAGPKLQGIIFNPRSPSATISGKSVFVGERVGEWKVVAIDKESAKLVRNGETIVLKFAE